MKAIILNGSPRKNWNTAMMLKSAQQGAESVGAETESKGFYLCLFLISAVSCTALGSQSAFA